MSYQFLNPAPVLFNIPGTQPASGGSLAFYEVGTTDDKDTWSDPAMDPGDLNTNPVLLDSSGRSNTAIWLDGEYTVELKDSLGATIWTRDITSGQDVAASIPTLVNGWFLTNDNTNLIWAEVRQMPDPTGSTNQYPVTDGNGYVLTNIPTDPVVPDPEIVIDAASFRAGISTDETKFLIKKGTGSAPASGTKGTTLAVVFDTPFDVLWGVVIQPTGGGVTSDSEYVRHSVISPSATGFTAGFSTKTGGSSADSTSNSNITSVVPFTWFAFGTVEVAP